MGKKSRLRMTGLNDQQRFQRSLSREKKAIKKRAQQAKNLMKLFLASLGVKEA